jgi:hypothetical protein
VNAYLCVYRHIVPRGVDLRRTEEAAVGNPALRAYLDAYAGSFYDWGDDPAFFAAERMLGDVREASWGVCRRDVRAALDVGDLVVFFCARQAARAWSYHFVGCATVGALVERHRLWDQSVHARYRAFFNVLARVDGADLVQHELIHRYHDDWRKRATAPYVLFDPQRTRFNLKTPHLVAEWIPGAPQEAWRDDESAERLRHLLFVERAIRHRGLRTSSTQRPHPKLNLAFDGGVVRPGRSLPKLRDALFAFA